MMRLDTVHFKLVRQEVVRVRQEVQWCDQKSY